MKLMTFLLTFGCLFSAYAFDFSTYQKVPDASEQRIQLIENGSFEQNFKLANQGKYVAREKNFGRNGGGGLRISCSPAVSKQLTMLPIISPLLPGRKYKMTAAIREEGDARKILCVEVYKKNGPYVYGIHTFGKVKTEGEWTHYEGTFTTRGEDPSQHDYRVTMGALIGKKVKGGNVFFDDIELYEDTPEWYFFQTWPTHNRVSPADGKIRFNNTYIGPVFQPDAKPLLVLQVLDSRKKILVEKTIVPEKAAIENDFGKLPEGKYTLAVTLLDTKNKLIIGRKEIPLSVDAPKTPLSSCVIDEKGRAIVNGKPMMLLGFYAGFENADLSSIEKEVAKIASAGFNVMHDYQFMWRKRSDAETKAYLDMCHKNGIMVSFGMLRYGSRKDTPENRASIRQIVNMWKDHPAVLAWYLADEPAPTLIPNLAASRKLINELDPNHPTWLVTVFPYDIHRTLPGTDVYSYDPYPIRDTESNLIASTDAADAIEKTGVVYWTVPQAFNWGNYQPDQKAIKDLTLYRQFAEPTENQMIANALLHACAGAKAFIFYAYHSINKGPDPSLYGKRWEAMCSIAKTMKELEPFIMSDAPIRKLAVENRKGKVRASLFRDEKGRERVIVIGIEKENDAVFTLPGKERGFRSRYGKIKYCGDGKYQYTGPAISCDILESI